MKKITCISNGQYHFHAAEQKKQADEIKIHPCKKSTFNNLADKLSRLPGLTLDAQPVLIPDGAPLLVYPDQRHGVDEGQQDGGEPDTAGLALNVEHVGVALGGAVKLTDALHSKSEKC